MSVVPDNGEHPESVTAKKPEPQNYNYLDNLKSIKRQRTVMHKKNNDLREDIIEIEGIAADILKLEDKNSRAAKIAAAKKKLLNEV